jgi:hypothetical protein
MSSSFDIDNFPPVVLGEETFLIIKADVAGPRLRGCACSVIGGCRRRGSPGRGARTRSHETTVTVLLYRQGFAAAPHPSSRPLQAPAPVCPDRA